MATESPVRILPGGGMTGGLSALSDSLRTAGGPGLTSSPSREAHELNLLLRERSRLESVLNGRDMHLHRSESAPPSVEGSLAAIGGIFAHNPTTPGALDRISKGGLGDGLDVFESEQELRSDPAYLAYYHSHVNLNPRLPPPVKSWENWRLAQRLQSGISVGAAKDKRKFRSFDDSNSKSLFSSQPLLPTHKEEPEHMDDERSLEHLIRHTSSGFPDTGDGLVGLGMGLGRPKSLVDLIQEDFPRTPSPVYNHSRPSSRAANEDGVDSAAALELQFAHLHELASGLGSRSSTPNPGNVQVVDDLHDSVAVGELNAGGFSSRSTTPNPGGLQMLGSSASVNSGPVEKIPSPDATGGAASTAIAMLAGASGFTSLNPESRIGRVDVSTAADLAAALQGLKVKRNDALEESDRKLEPTEQQLQQQREQRERAQIAQAQAQAQVYTQAVQQHLYNNSDQSYRGHVKFGVPGLSAQTQAANLQQTLHSGAAAPNMYAAAAAAAAMSYIAAGNPYYQNLHSTSVYPPHYGIGGFPLNAAMFPPMIPGYPAPGSVPVAFDNAAAAAVAASMGGRGASPGSPAAVDLHQFYKLAGQVPSTLQDALYLQYLRASEDARAAAALTDTSVMRGYIGTAHSDALDLQTGQLGGALGYSLEQKSQFARSGTIGVPLANKSGSVSPYYGSPPGVGFLVPYPNSPLASPVLPSSPVGPSSLSLRREDRSLRLTSTSSRTTTQGGYTGWQPHRSNETSDEVRGSFLLEEFKNSKNRRFDLLDIAGHVVEFSADQHGSRFIQQKLETATSEEKSMVFQEVLPQAVTLMTDVFGNYVIQKFFEHGTAQQRRELAHQLVNRVLTLSLQMYGCRVIQKALEAVDVDQQTQLVSELDGHVMRCVRDQNGNHVIQKCIECVPPDRIRFIINAFYGQVLVLSTHPYGCRVIQRVLEHCTDEQKQQGIMEEILRSTCSLAQDQYGNYVVQHVLEHGTQSERSEIITKLAGQIVQMSQHKFASNVIEKCLEFGGPAERQILIDEMLGSTDENEPLQAMMKDQFANYVVQKVLEICDDHQREMLLARIKVHLHALKKYTYGKHIVARVEKLVAAGERRSAAHAAHFIT